jgi:hypothetical protein
MCLRSSQGIYPTLIIVLVKLQKSVWDTAEVNKSLHSRMQFASAKDTRTTQAAQSHGTDGTDTTMVPASPTHGDVETGEKDD